MDKCNTENEIWKDIKGYEGYYQISNFGKVKSLDRVQINSLGYKRKLIGRILKPSLRQGYPRIILAKDGDIKHINIHRLVAKHFVKNNNIEENNCVNHIDGNKENNHYSNLEWITSLENSSHASRIGLYKTGENHPDVSTTIDEAYSILDDYYLNNMFQNDIAKKYNCTQSLISSIVLGNTWHYRECNDLKKYLDKLMLIKPIASSIVNKEMTQEIMRLQFEEGMSSSAIFREFDFGVSITILCSIKKGKHPIFKKYKDLIDLHENYIRRVNRNE